MGFEDFFRFQTKLSSFNAILRIFGGKANLTQRTGASLSGTRLLGGKYSQSGRMAD